jgi:putative proteasome-type protease
MTYCVGLLVDTGLVMLSDSRTNAGVDQINTFRKMATFPQAHDRVLVLLSAGNLAITQAVVNLLHESPGGSDGPTRFMQASNMFNAARVVGDALREIHERDAESLRELGHDFNGTFIWQPDQGRAAAFHIYSAGNFISPPATRRIFRSASRKCRKPIIEVHFTATIPPRRPRRAGLHGFTIRPICPRPALISPSSARRVQARHPYQHRCG